MADAKIDKSLDDIIKERKISSRGAKAGQRGRGAGGRGAARGAGGLRRGGAAGNAAANRSFGRNRNNNGMVQKRRSAGSPLKGAAMGGQWTHDLFQGRRSAGGRVEGQTGSAKLVISNLDFGVNDEDIKGLFQEFGNIKKAAVHYDRSGRSLGTADVVFERKPDAIKALKKYNKVSLDGRPMDIKLTAGLEQTVSVAPRLSVGSAPARRGAARGAMAGRGGRGGRGGAKTPREPKPVKTAADLDADLDTYNSKMQTD